MCRRDRSTAVASGSGGESGGSRDGAVKGGDSLKGSGRSSGGGCMGDGARASQERVGAWAWEGRGGTLFDQSGRQRLIGVGRQ